MIYRFYGSGNGTSIASIAIDGRMDDKIIGVYFDIAITIPTDGESTYAELSWNTLSYRATNDATGILASSNIGIELTTSGLAVPSIFKYFDFQGNPVSWSAGERLFLHNWTTTTTVQTIYAFVITEGNVKQPKSRK